MTQLTNILPPVTEWFDGKTTVPGQPGFYQRDWSGTYGETDADCWDGAYWWYGVGSWGDYRVIADEPAGNQHRNWRGLTEEVK